VDFGIVWQFWSQWPSGVETAVSLQNPHLMDVFLPIFPNTTMGQLSGDMTDQDHCNSSKNTAASALSSPLTMKQPE
jgi:hypothetical protein